jgi:hypothetical protein
MKSCFNHPDKIAVSICHGCGKDYCELCLDEGTEYYYCKNSECQKLLKEELPPEKLPENVICPNCGIELDLSKDEMAIRKVHCPKCETLIDFKYNPPKILNAENYVELLSSLNQGDIALIKSILDDGGIDYNIVGENFLSVRPLLEPARFFVNESQLKEATELLKNIDLHIFGFSTNQQE